MVQFSAKVSVPLSLWNAKSGGAIGKSKCILGVNGELDKMCVVINSAYKELLEKKEDVSASEVKTRFKESHPSRKRWSGILRHAMKASGKP